MPSFRLAIVLSHPTQYYSPWFRNLASRSELEIKVFYLWDSGVTAKTDRDFGTNFTWDIPLLDGYDHEFLNNRSRDPGTHHFKGLDNPGAVAAIASWQAGAVLMFGYNFLTHLRLILSPRLRRVPILFRGDSHELCQAGGWRPALTRRLRSLIFKRFVGFLAVGQANAEYFRLSGVAAGRISMAPHCVDNARFQSAAPKAAVEAAEWKRELGIPEGTRVLLFAGKFEEKKRPLDLLRAFRALQAEGGGQGPTPWVLLFVGNGEQEAGLRKAAGDELGRSVCFAPFQNQSQMPKVYAAGDVLILPSFGRGETWGLAVNEAMNLARPAIVSSHVGCGTDLIIPGETGWIFPAGEVEALVAVLREAMVDPLRLAEMGRTAQRRLSGFSYEVAGDALIAAIHRLLPDPSGSHADSKR